MVHGIQCLKSEFLRLRIIGRWFCDILVQEAVTNRFNKLIFFTAFTPGRSSELPIYVLEIEIADKAEM